jgi:hypothetical protein
LGLTVTTDWISEYAQKFTKKNIGIIGKTSTPKLISEKLTRFMKEYKFDKETILNATDMYINFWKKQGKPQFIREAHYFVYKRTERGSETSDLASWCQTYLDEGNKTKKEDRFGGDL